MSTARLAGFLYLIVVISGIFSLGYVPSHIAMNADDTATVTNILNAEALFRGGIAAGLVCYTAFLLLPLALFRLLEPAGQMLARAMVALASVSVPMAILNLAHLLQAAAAARAGQADLTLSEIGAYDHGLLMVQLFWGLWLLPLGLLVLRSRAIPRLLGVLLLCGCLAYVSRVFGNVLFADSAPLPGGRYIAMAGSLGEIGTCLWLLIMGARPLKSPAHTPHQGMEATEIAAPLDPLAPSA